jgi:hypothetical protein
MTGNLAHQAAEAARAGQTPKATHTPKAAKTAKTAHHPPPKKRHPAHAGK